MQLTRCLLGGLLLASLGAADNAGLRGHHDSQLRLLSERKTSKLGPEIVAGTVFGVDERGDDAPQPHDVQDISVEATFEEPATTDSGRLEEALPLPRIIIPTPRPSGDVPCVDSCRGNTICWQGECVYRPWKYWNLPKPSCYADPHMTGLTREEILLCRLPEPTGDATHCATAAAYCVWRSDAPLWYLKVQQEDAQQVQADEEWVPQQPQSAIAPVVNTIAGVVRPANPVVDSVLTGRPYKVNPPWVVPPRSVTMGRSQQQPLDIGHTLAKFAEGPHGL